MPPAVVSSPFTQRLNVAPKSKREALEPEASLPAGHWLPEGSSTVAPGIRALPSEPTRWITTPRSTVALDASKESLVADTLNNAPDSGFNGPTGIAVSSAFVRGIGKNGLGKKTGAIPLTFVATSTQVRLREGTYQAEKWYHQVATQ